MSNTDRFIVSYFNKNSWDSCGISWLASLVELGNYSGKVIIVDCGLSSKQKTFLDSINVITIPLNNKYNIEFIDFLYTLFTYNKNGIFAYWNCNSYFQKDINDVFEENNRCDDFFVCNGKTINAIGKFIEYCTDMEIPCSLDTFSKYFDFKIDNSWNKKIGNDLHWNNGFYCGENKVKVINIPLNMQSSAESIPFKFKTKYFDLYNKWLSYYKGNTFTPKRVMRFKRA